jgi:hypothetical protein
MRVLGAHLEAAVALPAFGLFGMGNGGQVVVGVGGGACVRWNLGM